MARHALLLALVLATLGTALWGLGAIGPRAGEVGGEPGGSGPAPDLATGPEGAPAPDAARAGDGGLASGAPRVVARSRPPSVDGPRITGRVTDPAGKGIRDARVLSIPDTATSPFSLEDVGTEACPAFDAVTDAEGRFAVAVRPDAPYHTLVAEAAGLAPGVRQNVPTFAEVTLVLLPGAVLAGTVTDPEGNGLAGARVRVLAVLDLVRRDVEATAAEGGAYRVEGLPTVSGGPAWAGAVKLAMEVTAEGFAPLFLPLDVGDLRPGKDLRRDVILARGATVRGRVHELEGGRPVAGARVVLWSAEGFRTDWIQRPSNPAGAAQVPWSFRRLAETASDAEGRYAFEHVPCRAFHDVRSAMSGRRGPVMGYVVAIATGYVPQAEDVPVARDGAAWEIDVPLPLAAHVTGRVVDKEGSPVPGARVFTRTKRREGATWVPPELFRGVPHLSTLEGVGPDGRYALAVPCEGGRAVDATLAGRLPPRSPWASGKPEGDGSVTVSVTAGATVEAPDLVLDAGPAEGPALRVLVRTRDGKPAFGATAYWNEVGAVARADAEGLAAIPIPVGTKEQPYAFPTRSLVTVRAPGYAPSVVPVTGPAPSAPLEVTLEPAHRLTGRVLWDDGIPVARARVAVGDGSRAVTEVFPASDVLRGAAAPAGTKPVRFGEAYADAEGRFVFEDLPEGPYHLAAWAAIGPSASRASEFAGLLTDVASGTSDLEIRLPRAASVAAGGIEGRAVDATTKRPVPGLVTRLQRPGPLASPGGNQPGNAGSRGPGPGSLTSPGAFEFREVFAGAWTLYLSADGYRPAAVDDVVVRAGEVTNVGPVAMDRGVRVRGRLRTPEGVTLEGRVSGFLDVSAASGPGRFVPVEVARDGTFEGTGFTPGTWRLRSHRVVTFQDSELPLVAPTEALLVIREGEVDVTFDASLVVSGILSLDPTDERLPPPPWQSSAPPTEAQRRFGEAARLLLKDEGGRVIGEQQGLRRSFAGALQRTSTAPGRYVVRYEAPGDEPREQSVVVRGGETTMVSVTATSITTAPGNAATGPSAPPRIR